MLTKKITSIVKNTENGNTDAVVEYTDGTLKLTRKYGASDLTPA